MKASSILIAATSFALFLSCEARLEETIQVPEMSVAENAEEIVFYAETEAEATPDTKAAVQEDARSIWWEPGDKIKVFKGDASGVFTTTIETPSANAEFKGSFSSPGSEDGTVFAVYPASAVQSFDGTNFTINIPSEQRPPKGSFDRNALVSIAQSNSKNLNFRLAIGGIKFSVSRPDIDKVVIVTFMRNSNGLFKVSLNNNNLPTNEETDETSNFTIITPSEGECFVPGEYYYAALSPGFYRYQIYVYSTGKLIGVYNYVSKSINRASVGVLSDLDKKLDYSIDNIPVPEAIDLGLPSGNLWASFNLGASSPAESGYYYAWGEVCQKNINYEWKNYLCPNKYGKDKLVLDPEDDAAFVALGDGWHIPTPNDFRELFDNCTWKWTTVNNVNGYNVKSNLNDAQIFIPTAGYIEYYYERVIGLSTGMYLSNTITNTVNASVLQFSSSNKQLYGFSRTYGYTIRPVCNGPSAFVYISSVKIEPAQIDLNVGDSYQLQAMIIPENATDKTLKWSSSNSSVVKVDSKGLITALAEGTATIKASTTNYLVAECKVTVKTVPVTGISISNASLELFVDSSAQLSASVIPSNATVKDVTWSSNLYTVATVSSTGVVRAISTGVATITATSKDGGFKKSCIVTVSEMPVPTAVDLGLSVKWASFNVGASKPEENGCLYAWGETSTKSEYTVDNYKWWDYRYMGSNTYTRILKKYKGENDYSEADHTLEEEDDIATVKYGSGWFMPSCIQIQELIDNCEWTYTRVGNVNGYKVQSKKNSNYIFLPIGNYWSSSLDSSKWYGRLKQKGVEVGGINNYSAYGLFTYYDPPLLGIQDRSVGYMVRAVYGKGYW